MPLKASELHKNVLSAEDNEALKRNLASAMGDLSKENQNKKTAAKAATQALKAGLAVEPKSKPAAKPKAKNKARAKPTAKKAPKEHEGEEPNELDSEEELSHEEMTEEEEEEEDNEPEAPTAGRNTRTKKGSDQEKAETDAKDPKPRKTRSKSDPTAATEPAAGKRKRGTSANKEAGVL